jgi:hypothetical protein
MVSEDVPQTELREQGTDEANGAPSPGFEDVDVGGLFGQARFAAEEAFETGQELLEPVLATEVGDDPLPDLAILAEGLDDADVLVDGAAGGRDFGRCGHTGREYHDRIREKQGQTWVAEHA